MKRNLFWFSQLFMVLLIVFSKILISLLTGYAVYEMFAPLAYAERGYMAFGGECILAIAASLGMGFLLFVSKRYLEDAKQKGKPPKFKYQLRYPSCRHFFQAHQKNLGR